MAEGSTVEEEISPQEILSPKEIEPGATWYELVKLTERKLINDEITGNTEYKLFYWVDGQKKLKFEKVNEKGENVDPEPNKITTKDFDNLEGAKLFIQEELNRLSQEEDKSKGTYYDISRNIHLTKEGKGIEKTKAESVFKEVETGSPKTEPESLGESYAPSKEELILQRLDETVSVPEFSGEGSNLAELKLHQRGQELQRIGEKSSNRNVFLSPDGRQVIKVSEIKSVAWQELIAVEDVPEDLRHLLEIPLSHGHFKVDYHTYYFEIMRKLETRKILNENVKALAAQLEPYLGKGEMNYAGQWGRREDGSLVIFDYLNWKKSSLGGSLSRYRRQPLKYLKGLKIFTEKHGEVKLRIF